MSVHTQASSGPALLPRIDRFRKLGMGLFLHWGLYSHEEKGEWAWQILNLDPVAYKNLTTKFDAADFDGKALARLARESGFSYIVLTTRHHDGFSLYDTRGLSTFDAPHSAAKRDLVAEFVEGCRSEGIIPFFYHTTLDWSWKNKKTENLSKEAFNEYLEYLNQSVEVLCRNYGEIGGLWFDGNWSRPDDDWKESELYNTIRKHQPEAIIVNNTGLFAQGETGHPDIDCLTYEQGLPTAPDQTGWPKYLAGEMCQTFNHHWGYARNDFHYLSLKEMIENFAHCRRLGMNYLFNVGPLASGAIPGLEKELLLRFGEWMRQGGRFLNDAVPATVIADSDRVFVMEREGDLYGAALALGIKGNPAVTVDDDGGLTVTLKQLDRPIREARWVDNDESLLVEQIADGSCRINLTANPYGTNQVVRVFKLLV